MSTTDDDLLFAGYAAEPALARLDCSQLRPGTGPAFPKVALVSDYPAAGDDAIVEARLALMLVVRGLPLDHCFRTTVVKVPLADREGRPRPPREKEIRASMPYLWRELEVRAAHSTRIVCALGRVAASALCGEPVTLAESHGKWKRITDPVGMSWMLYATYHPRATLHNLQLLEQLATDLGMFATEVDALGDETLARLRAL